MQSCEWKMKNEQNAWKKNCWTGCLYQTIRKSKMKNTHIILHTGWTCKRRWMAMSESYNILKYKVQHFQHSVAALNVTIECFALDGAC